MTAETPVPEGEGVAVPVTMVNSGDEPTGRQLAVSAQFVLSDGRKIDSDFKTVYDDGLAPHALKKFSLKVPKAVQAARRFRVNLTAREGIAAGIATNSPQVGFVSQWTRASEELSARILWPFY